MFGYILEILRNLKTGIEKIFVIERKFSLKIMKRITDMHFGGDIEYTILKRHWLLPKMVLMER